MTWDVQQRMSDREDTSSHVYIGWAGGSTVYEVAVIGGEGLRQTSMGMATTTRAEMTQRSKRLEAIYRWDEDNAKPTVLITWSERPGGPRLQAEVRIGR